VVEGPLESQQGDPMERKPTVPHRGQRSVPTPPDRRRPRRRWTRPGSPLDIALDRAIDEILLVEPLRRRRAILDALVYGFPRVRRG
jgi:hypothetical protein